MSGWGRGAGVSNFFTMNRNLKLKKDTGGGGRGLLE